MALSDWLPATITGKRPPIPPPEEPDEDDIPTPEGVNYAELWKEEADTSILPLILSGVAVALNFIILLIVAFKH